MRRAVVLALLVAGCGPGATRGVLTGPRDSVRQATTAARDCGIARLRIDPLDDRTAMLVVDPATPRDQIDCVRRWAAPHGDLRPVAAK